MVCLGQKKASINSQASSSSSLRTVTTTRYPNSQYTGTGDQYGTASRTRTRSRSGGSKNGSSCFVAGTRIALNDGRSFIDIEKIKLNDHLAWDLRVTGIHSFRHFLGKDELCAVY